MSEQNHKAHGPGKVRRPFTIAELPHKEGRIYHLCLCAYELADDIIIVGDPERVPLIANRHIAHVEVDITHRGLRTITGKTKDAGKRISITTSGMGTPSLEIVLNEIAALKQIDLHTGMQRTDASEPVRIIRIGTSGALPEDLPLGTLIISAYAVGLDNTGLFYDVDPPDAACVSLERKVRDLILASALPSGRFREAIVPYASKANDLILRDLEITAKELNVPAMKGITVSSSGFFANQGREVCHDRPTVPDIDELLGALDSGIDGLKFTNLEMETSFLFHAAPVFSFRAGSICVAAANRKRDTFAQEIERHVDDAARVAIRVLDK